MRSIYNGHGAQQDSGGPASLGRRFNWELALAKAGEWTLWRMAEGESPLTI